MSTPTNQPPESKGEPTKGPWVVENHAGHAPTDRFVVVSEPVQQRVAVISLRGAPAGDLSIAAANATLIAEVGTVYHETGLTPRQLVVKYQSAEGERAATFRKLQEVIRERDQYQRESHDLVKVQEDRDQLAERVKELEENVRIAEKLISERTAQFDISEQAQQPTEALEKREEERAALLSACVYLRDTVNKAADLGGADLFRMDEVDQLIASATGRKEEA